MASKTSRGSDHKDATELGTGEGGREGRESTLGGGCGEDETRGRIGNWGEDGIADGGITGDDDESGLGGDEGGRGDSLLGRLSTI